MQIELLKSFLRTARQLPKSRRREIARAIDALRDAFGQPHLHSGLGIRRLRRNYFECRAGIDTRLVFRAERGRIIFVTAGSHDAVRKSLKDL